MQRTRPFWYGAPDWHQGWIALLLCYVLFSTCCAADAQATPTVTVTAEPRDGYKYVVFTFVQDDLPSMDGCFYNFMASNSARKLEQRKIRALSIATFYRPESVIRIIAGPLDHLSRSFGRTRSTEKTAKVYFRTLITCYNGNITPAEVFSVTFKAAPRGELSGINELIKQMKYHMAYYDGD